MSHTVVVLGAGGKMGQRVVEKLAGNQEFRLVLGESGAERVAALKAKGLAASALESVLPGADFVIMCVPDTLIGPIAAEVVPQMKKGATLIMLDAAAAYVGELPVCSGVTYMITHPCHPPIFTEQATPEAQRDYFGGVAVQDIIVSLIQGSESNFSVGEQLCNAMFAPVRKTHRVTPEQFAILEPAMAEVVLASAACLMRQALDAAIEAGAPVEAAAAFMAGHAQLALAQVFGIEKAPFSDACKIAIEWGSQQIIQSDWRKVFQPEKMREAIQAMLHSERPTR